MPENILVCVAWPYANGSIHLGHVAGAYLPADIFARYHRIKGNNVIMVSGSDAHGTPVTITAENEGVSPEEIANKYQREFLNDWDGLGINWDLFTSTHTDNHFEVTQDIFLRLYEKGFIYNDTMSQPFCEAHDRFLADRYVEGICPHCNFNGARGDQCDGCGNTLDPKDLLDIKHKDCDSTPIFRDTEHFFLKLSAFEKALIDWASEKSHWKPNVKNFTLGFLEGGLIDRAITRDITWGIPIPLEGYEDKRIYVWFEAVIGYLSASIEWASQTDNPDQWQEYWKKDSKPYYFMGKDNIPFHTVIWPAMLMGYGNLNLPYDVPANEYVNMEEKKISTSRNWVVNLKDYLERYEPDPLRFSLASIMPETSDSNFSWSEYVRRNNDELVATFGNLVHRVLSMTNRYFDGVVPESKSQDDLDRSLLKKGSETLSMVSTELENCRFRRALEHSMSLAQEANRYLDEKAPWTAAKNNPESAGNTLYHCLNVINCLKITLAPILPFSVEKLHTMLGFEGHSTDQGWNWSPDEVSPGHKLGEAKALFIKLEDSVIDEEVSRLGIS
ncbi:MAG: methionine--tRNA ligase [Chloroflexota bacterium]|nr:methionine--tRNA ligase [Chloroflexota bacterium]